jgi:hypothetical protein
VSPVPWLDVVLVVGNGVQEISLSRSRLRHRRRSSGVVFPLVAMPRYSLLITPPMLLSRGENPNFVGRQRRHGHRDLLGGAAVGTIRVCG